MDVRDEVARWSLGLLLEDVGREWTDAELGRALNVVPAAVERAVTDLVAWGLAHHTAGVTVPTRAGGRVRQALDLDEYCERQ